MNEPTDTTSEVVTPRPWPENAWPTAAELADWLSRCTSEERLDYADRSLTTAQHAARCFDERHAARLAAAEREAAEKDERLAKVREFCDEHKGQWNEGLAKAQRFTFDGGVGAAAQDVLAILDRAALSPADPTTDESEARR